MWKEAKVEREWSTHDTTISHFVLDKPVRIASASLADILHFFRPSSSFQFPYRLSRQNWAIRIDDFKIWKPRKQDLQLLNGLKNKGAKQFGTYLLNTNYVQSRALNFVRDIKMTSSQGAYNLVLGKDSIMRLLD